MRPFMRFCALALSALGVLAVTQPAEAFVRQSPGCGGARWLEECPSGDFQCNENMLLPVKWYINSDDGSGQTYSAMSNAEVKRIFDEAWAAWSSPCCSDWAVSYQGTTGRTAFSQDNAAHVLSFHSAWPSSFGDVNTTLAVTPSIIRSDCAIIGSDIAFNTQRWTFIDADPPDFNDEADLQSIAVHEMGHFLGLDHSEVFGSSVWPSYSNGINERTLHQDDENGVCDIYPGTCTCGSDSDCDQNIGETCVSGTCTVVPCSTNDDCDEGLVCEGGDCVTPPCTSDDDCSAGYNCNTTTGDCEPDGTCAICRQCETNNDCGAGFFCADFSEDGSVRKCISWCDQAYNCPGDSECFPFQPGDGNVYPLCLNPNPGTTGFCPDSYTCANVPPSCDGLGDACSCDSNGCTGCTSPDNDICFSDGSSTFCSCSCTTDADCGEGNRCVSTSQGGACTPGSTTTDPCDGVTCPTGETCNPSNGQCESSSTGACPGLGETCTCDATGCTGSAGCTTSNDVCITGDAGTFCSCSCTSDADCGTGTCESLGNGSMGCIPGVDPCDGVSCPAGETCNPSSGQCEGSTSNPCDGVSCSAGETCNPSTGQCEGSSTGNCDGVVCPSGTTCDPSTGNCVSSSDDTGTADVSDDTGGVDTSTADTSGGSDGGMVDTGSPNINAGASDDCSCATLEGEAASERGPLLPLGALLVGVTLVGMRRRRRG